MRFLTVNTEVTQIKKEIQQDLEKIIFSTDSTFLTSSKKQEISKELETLVGAVFEEAKLQPLINFLLFFIKEREDEIRFEVFNLFCFLTQLGASEGTASFESLAGLLDQKPLFDSPEMAIRGFGSLLNLQKTDHDERIRIFKRLFYFVKKNKSMVLYKYSFDLPGTIGPLSRELHLEVLEYGLAVSKMKDLWGDFGKLLLVQVELFSEEETLPEDFSAKLVVNLRDLVQSLKGVFFLKTLRLNCHVRHALQTDESVENLVEALEKKDVTSLSSGNDSPSNKEKVQIVKMMSFLQKKCNWGLDELAEKVLQDSQKSSQKKIQGFLMKCMKQQLLSAKINRKTNSVLIT